MHNNTTKIMLLSIMMIGSLVSLCSNTWLGVWMGLEVNLLAFIPLLSNSSELNMNETAIKYFLIQTLASSMILFSVLMMQVKMLMINQYQMMNMLISSSLMLKLGVAPMHFWFIEVMGATPWNNCMMLMTWQKLAPLSILSYCSMNNSMMNIAIITCTTIGGIGGLNQTSLRKMMAFSSVSHMGWMIAATMLSEQMWETYFIMYSTISITVAKIMSQKNIFMMNQMYNSNESSKINSLIMIMSMLSLGGLPPFSGFFPKWMIIQPMIENKMSALTSIMILMTTMNLYYYIRISFSVMTFSSSQMKWMSTKSKMNNMSIMWTFVFTMSTLGLSLIVSLTNMT